jgi:hypothetical protein
MEDIAIDISYFKSQIEQHTTEAGILESQNRNLGKARLAVVLLAQAVLIYGHFWGPGVLSTYVLLVFALFMLVFLVLLFKSSKIKNKLSDSLCKIEVNKRSISRTDGTWVHFEQSGEEYIDQKHPFSSDLDIFGKASLFQYINETNTYFGKETLKNFLLDDKKEKHVILKRQQAVRELASNHDFCETLKCEGIRAEGISSNPEKLIDFLENDSQLFSRAHIKYLLAILPIITLSLLVINIVIGPTQGLSAIFVLALFLQVMINLTFSPKTEGILKEFDKFRASLNNLATMTSLIQNQKFEAEYNVNEQNKLANTGITSLTLQDLKRVSGAILVRRFALLDFVLNVFFLWDIFCVLALEKLRAGGAKNISTWLKSTGHFEALVSIALLQQLNPNWAYPEFTEEEKLMVFAENMGHPLITENVRVSNNIELNNITIISGSNMSGKSTFLRTIGINLNLAYLGGPVCATKFKMPLLDIYTCMRISDSLAQNTSTFYAELLRIKEIVDNAKLAKPMIFLIDEIFRGTNSEDRLTGAKQVLLNLRRKSVLGLITTHDLEVCSLADDDKGFSNYNFSEYYVDDKIYFDYKIKPGMSSTRNAKYLMKIIGIDLG